MLAWRGIQFELAALLHLFKQENNSKGVVHCKATLQVIKVPSEFAYIVKPPKRAKQGRKWQHTQAMFNRMSSLQETRLLIEGCIDNNIFLTEPLSKGRQEVC